MHEVAERVEKERVRLQTLATAEYEKARKEIALEASKRVADMEQQMSIAQQEAEKARFEAAAMKDEALRNEERAQTVRREAQS